MLDVSILRGPERAFVTAARSATLATIGPTGRPRVVPICFALLPGGPEPVVLVSPLDEKPKSIADPRGLARVRDVLADPRASLLVDGWSEDWTRLGWVRLDVRAELTTPDPASIDALRAKYPQYATHRLEERPLLRLTVERVVSWGDLRPARDPDDRDTARPRAAGGSGSSSSPGDSRRR